MSDHRELTRKLPVANFVTVIRSTLFLHTVPSDGGFIANLRKLKYLLDVFDVKLVD